jgi:hypothetical protein
VPDPASCGATTGWLASGGALAPPAGSDGSTGITTVELDCVGVGVGVGDALDGVGEGVGVGGGVGVWLCGVGASDSTGDAYDGVGAGGGGASTVIEPWPVRMPSVAVAVADLVAVNAADADAGVFAGIRSENDEPEIRTDTVTFVRLA